ncbi:hypothetical protein E0Z10_g6263 [Xylaria hypoxylon]|uniref:AB hydrolase-1 domain-containing protein n=1 Tax=Xylaria hypoxylon TaxID=37992 RepID=A0A4Z0YTN4_9PEZI|nr:hypothetical protein E0Z10_g6263 [Xylaria hypoxylon]
MAQPITGSLQLPSSRFVSWSYTPAGADGPCILLSNPLGTTFAVWDPVVPQLTALGFDVLRYDAPGHGFSGVPQDLSSTTLNTMAQDVRDLLLHLEIGQLHAWIGVSLGAATSIVFASKYNHIVERLIVCDTIPCSPVNEGTVDVFGPRVAAVRRAGNLDTYVEETLERWFGRPWLESNPARRESLQELMLDTTIDGFETCCAALRSTSFDLRRWASRAGSHVESAMLLVGEKDIGLFEGMEELRKDIEGGLRIKRGDEVSVGLNVVQNGGHVCFVDGFDSFTELITPFLTI